MDKEYIEREAVNEIIKQLSSEPLYQHEGEDYYAGVCDVDGELAMLPAADVVEVRHGAWVPYEQPLGVGCSIPNYKPTHCCSHCKGLGWEFYTICPHCGAKMDGKGEDNG